MMKKIILKTIIYLLSLLLVIALSGVWVTSHHCNCTGETTNHIYKLSGTSCNVHAHKSADEHTHNSLTCCEKKSAQKSGNACSLVHECCKTDFSLILLEHDFDVKKKHSQKTSFIICKIIRKIRLTKDKETTEHKFIFDPPPRFRSGFEFLISIQKLKIAVLPIV